MASIELLVLYNEVGNCMILRWTAYRSESTSERDIQQGTRGARTDCASTSRLLPVVQDTDDTKTTPRLKPTVTYHILLIDQYCVLAAAFVLPAESGLILCIIHACMRVCVQDILRSRRTDCWP